MRDPVRLARKPELSRCESTSASGSLWSTFEQANSTADRLPDVDRDNGRPHYGRELRPGLGGPDERDPEARSLAIRVRQGRQRRGRGQLVEAGEHRRADLSHGDGFPAASGCRGLLGYGRHQVTHAQVGPN